MFDFYKISTERSLYPERIALRLEPSKLSGLKSINIY